MENHGSSYFWQERLLCLHEIAHEGVAFTPPHENSPQGHFRRHPVESGKNR
jgi:hypothetical protein